MDRLSAMEAFVLVVETGSFSAAARRLHLGQPAISKVIAQLETRLGVQLFIRSTRDITVTAAGLNFFERARRAIAEAAEAESSARAAETGLAGRLRVCAAVTFARIHLLPHLAPFLDQNPDLELELVLDDRAADLVQDGLDFALTLGARPNAAPTTRRLAQGRRRVVGSASYFQRHGVPVSPRDLMAHPAVILNLAGEGADWTFRRGHEVIRRTLRGRLQVTAAEGQRAAVLADAGIAIASEWTFAPELASGAVQAVVNDWRLPDIELWAVFPTDRVATTKARSFATFVEGLLGAQGEFPDHLANSSAGPRPEPPPGAVSAHSTSAV